MPLGFENNKEFENINRFMHNYGNARYSDGQDFYNISAGELRYLNNFLYKHYYNCKFFNGFSISRSIDLRRQEGVIIRCSCGQYVPLSEHILYNRNNNMDLEDLIMDLNHQHYMTGKTKDMCAILNANIQIEITRRKMIEEELAINKSEEFKSNINGTFGLEISD